MSREQKAEADATGAPYVDHEWLPGDPVWAVYRAEGEEWCRTREPQTIGESILHMGADSEGTALDALEIYGRERGLYGGRYVMRGDLFRTAAEAEAECTSRNV